MRSGTHLKPTSSAGYVHRGVNRSPLLIGGKKSLLRGGCLIQEPLFLRRRSFLFVILALVRRVHASPGTPCTASPYQPAPPAIWPRAEPFYSRVIVMGSPLSNSILYYMFSLSPRHNTPPSSADGLGGGKRSPGNCGISCNFLRASVLKELVIVCM
jgi:hypothetical protein